MLVILSPAKTMNFDTHNTSSIGSTPIYKNEADILAKEFQKLSVSTLSKQMRINAKIADLNYNRFQNWDKAVPKQAIFVYSGEVYRGLDIFSFTQKDLIASQKILRVLSGMYGILKPLDLVKPYRLEMGLKKSFPRFKNLYEFWGDKIRCTLEKELAGNNHPYLINLASLEYLKAIQSKKINVPIYQVSFKEMDGNKIKTITVYEKKARGMMARFIIKNHISNPSHLQAFNEDGYMYNSYLSKPMDLVFTRLYKGKV